MIYFYKYLTILFSRFSRSQGKHENLLVNVMCEVLDQNEIVSDDGVLISQVTQVNVK